MSIWIIKTSEINRDLLDKNTWKAIWEDSLTKQWIEYVLDNPEKEFEFRKNPKLIQRMEFNKNWSVDYDYMWSSEFETWIVWKTTWKIIEWHEKGELVLFSSDDWNIEWFCHLSVAKEAKEQTELLVEWDKDFWLNSKFNLQEQMYSDRYSNFLNLDNAFFFSTSWEALKYLKHLDYTALRRLHIEKIRNYPKFVELEWLVEKVELFLENNWVGVTYIWVDPKWILEKTFEDWIIEDSDFNHDIWINSNNEDVCDWWCSEQDMRDTLEWKSGIFTNKFWLKNTDFCKVAKSWYANILNEMIDIFILSYKWSNEYISDDYPLKHIMANIDEIMENFVNNPELNRQIIDKLVFSWFFDSLSKWNDYSINYLIKLAWNIHASEKVVKKAKQTCKWRNTKQQRKLKKALYARSMEISDIWKKTMDDIRRVYSDWSHVSMYSNTEEVWWLPSQLWINFSNNLARMWFKTKELNVYVDPDEYEKKYNEILIWDTDHNSATIEVWPSNYEWIKECLYMEQLTWIKQISWRNIAYGKKIDHMTFNEYYGNGLVVQEVLKDVEKDLWIEIRDVFWLFWRVDDTNERWERPEDIKRFVKLAEEKVWINNIVKLKEIDIEEITYKYFTEKFPWELTDEQYRNFAVGLNEWLNEQLDKLLEFVRENG